MKEDGSCGYKAGEEEYKDPVYTPMGVFITSWARYTTITTAQKCFDRIIYCDTDSIHILGTEIPEAIADIIDDNKLGYWKHESTFDRCKFLRQKTYCEQIKKHKGWLHFKKKLKCKTKEKTVKLWFPKPEVKCSGMPDNIKDYVSLKNFEVGFSMTGNLAPCHVDGGIVLVDSDFTIR